MTERELPNPGDVYVVPWPFMRDEEAIEGNKSLAQNMSEIVEIVSADPSSPFRVTEDPAAVDVHAGWEWKPGMKSEWEQHDQWSGQRTYHSDGLGRTEITVVSVHRPTPRHDYRIFYYQRWLSPDGRVEGKRALKMKTLRKFRVIAKGIMPDDWDAEIDEETVSRALEGEG